jgi:hypothetical protein
MNGFCVSLGFEGIEQRTINEVLFEPLDGRRSRSYGRQIDRMVRGLITDKYVGWLRLEIGHQQPYNVMNVVRTIVGGSARRCLLIWLQSKNRLAKRRVYGL